MNIKLVFPTEESDLIALQDCIDTLHCNMIFTTLNSLDIPYNEKLKILDDAKQLIASKSFNPNWMSEYGHQNVV